MSPSSATDTGKLTFQVNAADTETEIFVMDGDLRLVDRGVGSLTTKPLDRGIYKVKACTASAIQEQYVVLKEPGLVVTIGLMAFASPAPLSDTTRTHEYHMHSAQVQSLNVHASHGAGSSIFVFAREWTKDDPDLQAIKSLNPLRGINLLTADGAPLEAIETSAVTDSSMPDPWAACNVVLTPGPYRLSLQLPTGDRQELMVFAAAGWQTQIFLLQRTSGQTRIADLPKAAIYMAHQADGFLPSDRQTRQVELARLGLSHQRKVLSSDITSMLRQKFDNPMLGILAGHLLDMSPEPDLLAIVVQNLRIVFQTPHPDVEALALAAGMPVLPCSYAPMLRRSWELISRAASQPKGLPPLPAVLQFTDRIWGEEPWLIRSVLSADDNSLRDMVPDFALLEAETARTSAFSAVQEWRSGKPLAPLPWNRRR
jgi:hypothetical protein